VSYHRLIQAALDSASRGGGLVEMPIGQFALDSPITIPQGVTLKGSWEGPHDAILDKGTTIRTKWGEGNKEEAPLISMNKGATIEGISVYYPRQVVKTPFNALQYPWTISLNYSDCNVINVTLANAYQGIKAEKGHERHFIYNVHMCALKTGIWIDRCWDMGRIENVNIHQCYWWASNPEARKATDAISTFTLSNLNGFVIGHTDWEQMIGCFVYQAAWGIRFQKGADWNDSLQTNLLASGCFIAGGCDLCHCSIEVERVHPAVGFKFSSSQFLGVIDIDSTNNGPLQFDNCVFQHGWSTQPYIIGNKSRNSVLLANSIFSKYNASDSNNTVAIKAYSGSTLLSNCVFDQRCKNKCANQIEQLDTAASVLGVNLRFNGPARIYKKNPADTERVKLLNSLQF